MSAPAIRSGGHSLLAGALLLAACAPPEPPPPPDVYEFRGEVTQLPGARPGAELMIRHESMPDFKNAEGEVIGMESMTMPFAVADQDVLDRIYVGDKVAANLEVRWDGRNPLVITRLEKLPPETRLDFEDASEDGATGSTESPAADAPPEEQSAG